MRKCINNIKKTIAENLSIMKNKTFKRDNKIKIEDILFYISNLISSNKNSSPSVVVSIQMDDICDASESAFRKKLSLIDPIYFSNLVSSIHFLFYKGNHKLLNDEYRVLAVDGTHVPLSKDLKENGYKLTKNETYVDGLFSVLYDVHNKLILDINHEDLSERKLFEHQIKLLRKNDIILLDRGYYSKKLLFCLTSKNIFPIFRLTSNLNIYKDFIKSGIDDKLYEILDDKSKNIVKLRLVKYIINKSVFVIATTLYNANKDTLSGLYKSRWDIEECNKMLKYNLSFDKFHSKNIKSIRKEIYTHIFIHSLTRLLENSYIHYNKIDIDNKKTNLKINLKMTTEKILTLLLYDKNGTNKITKIMKILLKYLTTIRKNRSYPRKRITPPSKWYRGNKLTI